MRLAQQQRQLADYIRTPLGGTRQTLTSDYPHDPIRSAVHRRHHWLSYQSAMATNFPLTAAVLGEEFSQLALKYLALHPWRQTSLTGLGEGFSEWLSGCVERRFVVDCARFDFARQCALRLHCSQRSIAGTPKTEQLDSIYAVLCEHLLIEPFVWNVADLWQSHLDGRPLCVEPAQVWMVFQRVEQAVVYSSLTPAQHQLRLSLAERSVASALTDAFERGQSTDVTADLLHLIQSRLIIGWEQRP
ncbi:MAG: putative DNA-binding domain-containing protein [Gammaproteobacteria bacterium]|nr:putative DNA-binding domain-containing protein [Gammaproteobacteria bacterium]